MGLNEKILQSRQQVAAYTVQPYQPLIGRAAYGNRNISPEMVQPPVFDKPIETSQPITKNRDVQVGVTVPVPVILSNGTAPNSGSSYGRRAR